MKGKSLSLFGTALTLALTANVAVAQSSQSPTNEANSSSADSTTEIQLSPEGFKILCERSPLNSRCPGGTPLTSGIPGSKSFEGGNTPTNITPAPETITPEPSAPTNITPAPETITPESGAPTNITPAPETITPEPSAPTNITPAPETITPEPSAPTNITPAPETITPESGAPTNITPAPGTSTTN